jgi:hypothetical protein
LYQNSGIKKLINNWRSRFGGSRFKVQRFKVQRFKVQRFRVQHRLWPRSG